MRIARFATALASFHLQWLDLTELGAVEKRTKLYPLFTPALRAAMREETVRFVDHVIRRRTTGGLQTLLTGRFSIVGEGLFQLYGLGAQTGQAASWRKVDWIHRAGRAAVASQLSHRARPLGQAVAGAAGQGAARDACSAPICRRRRPT